MLGLRHPCGNPAVLPLGALCWSQTHGESPIGRIWPVGAATPRGDWAAFPSQQVGLLFPPDRSNLARVRYIDRFSLPTGRGWAAQALDFKASDSFIRGVPGGGPVVILTIAQSEAQNIAHTTQDKKTEARQEVTVGSTGMSQKDVNIAQ